MNMRLAALALALGMLATACGPGQFLGPTVTPSPTLTPTFTPTPVPTSTPTLLPQEAGQQEKVLRSGITQAYGVAFTSDGKLLATQGSDGDGERVALWQTDGWTKIREWSLPQTFSPADYSADGRWLATSNFAPCTVEVWDASTEKQLVSLPYCADDVSIAPNRSWLAIAAGRHSGSRLILWDMEKQSEILNQKGQPTVMAIAFSPDGKFVATAGGAYGQNTVRIFVASGAAPPRDLAPLVGPFSDLTFSLDGTLLIAGGAPYDPDLYRSIRVWEVGTWKEMRLFAPTRRVSVVAVSPASRMLAVVHMDLPGDPAIYLYDLSSGKPIKTLEGHTGQVHSLAFSPDGSHLASASSDGTTRIWDLGGLGP
jgi:WD40 repeat protein